MFFQFYLLNIEEKSTWPQFPTSGMKHECLTLGHSYPIGGSARREKKSGGFFLHFFLEGVFINGSF